MNKNKKSVDERLELRRRAEEYLEKSGLNPDSPASTVELTRILHELSVHQVELEMQNDELKKSHDEIQKEHSRYTDLYDFAPVGYLTLDAESKILEANLTADRMISLGRHQLKGARFGNFIVQQDLSVFNSMMQKVFKRRTIEHCEVMIKNVAPEAASLHRIFRLDALISDNLQECRLTLTDISDTRRAVDALKNREEQYRRLFEAAQEGILILDYKSGKITDANPFMTHLVGFTLDEIKGKKLWEIGFIQDKEQIQNAYLKLQSDNNTRYTDISLKHKSGQIIDVEFHSYVYNVGDQIAVQCNVRDISVHKKLREYEKSIASSRKETINALIAMVEVRDQYTIGHQGRVAELAMALGKELDLSPNSLEGLHMSALLHDIGKFNIPTDILIKITPLTEPEKDILRNHPQAGYDVLKFIHFPWPIALIVLQHHERLDGSGYPNRLKGQSIMEEAKIIGVSDTVEAMTGNRPYRAAIGIDKALQYIQQESGRLFDPLIVDTCVRLFQEKKFSFSPRPATEVLVPLNAEEGYGKSL
ncbi:MAG: HD domain-containing phosphohydrolase [Chlorobiaceae bacterium]